MKSVRYTIRWECNRIVRFFGGWLCSRFDSFVADEADSYLLVDLYMGQLDFVLAASAMGNRKRRRL